MPIVVLSKRLAETKDLAKQTLVRSARFAAPEPTTSGSARAAQRILYVTLVPYLGTIPYQ